MPEIKTAAKSEKKKTVPKGLVSRQTALTVLVQVDARGAYANLALNAAFKKTQLSVRDRAFVTALVQGVLRHRLEIDEKIAALASQPLAKMPDGLRNILRMAVFQIDHMEDIPASAVVNTASELAKVTAHKGQVKFVNGLLRNYLRGKEGGATARPSGKKEDATAGSASSLSAKYSTPAWLVERWLANFGEEETIALLKYFQTPPDLVLRTCSLAITTEGLKEILAGKKIKTRRGSLVPDCLIVEERKGARGAPEKMPGFAEGLFSVQDEAAALVSIVVDAKPGDLVIDLCAAPGGKSLHLGEMMQNNGRVVAVDNHTSRLNLIRKNRRRLGLTNIEIVEADGRNFTTSDLAARVLVDAPCTGTGVMNRRTDIRFNKEAPDITSLVKLQRELLLNAARLVKPEGVLVYSTCSIEPEENSENIEWFLSAHENFAGDDLSPCFPAGFMKMEKHKHMIQLLPTRHAVSGFFIARLKRTS